MENFDIHRFLKILNSKKLYIAFILILSLAMGYFYSYYYLTPMYKSSATIVLVKNNDLSTADSDSITQKDITLNQNLLSTYTKIAKSNKVIKQVIDNLGLNMSEQQLSSAITIQSVNNTEVFKVFVANKDSNLAASITNELVNVFSNEIKSLYNMNNVYIMDNAEPSTIPYNINHIKDLGIFAMIGIVISFGLMICIYFFDNTIKSEHDIEDYANLSVLSSIPLYNKDKEKVSNELIVNEKPKSPIAECFKTFRTNVMFSIQNKELNTILVTSGFMSEGKSFVSSNLAITFAQSGKNVILVDTDMRKGRQHKIFGVSNKNGLSNCLSDIAINGSSVNINDYIKETKIPNLHIMTSGDVPPNPSELLSSPNMQKFLKALNSQYDVVICDGTPCMLVSDSVILSKIVDTTVIVTANRQTKLDTLLKIKKSIDIVGGHIGGAVINKMQVNTKEYKSQYYYGDISSTNSTFEYSMDSNSLLENTLNISEDSIENTCEEIAETIDIPDANVPEYVNSINDELTKGINLVKSDVEEIKTLYNNLINNNVNTSKENGNNFNAIIDELNSIKDLYNYNIDKQNEQIKALSNKLNNIEFNDNSDAVIDELNSIKDLYNYNIDKQNEQIKALSNKLDNIEFADNSDAIINELNSIKDLYNYNIDKQNEQIKALSNKLDNIEFNDNSDAVIDELNSIKDLYNYNIDKQNRQIRTLNDKINNIEFIDNSDILLKEMANIYKYLDNINNRFTYLEEKAKNNEILIKQISKNTTSNSQIKENKIIDISKLNDKVIQIQDYLEESFIKEENNTNNSKKYIKKSKNILDGQLNILDDIIDNPKTEQNSTIEQPVKKESERKYVVDYEKVARKHRKGFSLFKNKELIEEDEEPINIVSQILREDVV